MTDERLEQLRQKFLSAELGADGFELFEEIDALTIERDEAKKTLRDAYAERNATLASELAAACKRNAQIAARVRQLEAALRECVEAYQAADSQRTHNATIAARAALLPSQEEPAIAACVARRHFPRRTENA